MNFSLLLTKRLNCTENAEQIVADAIRAGVDHVYINWAEGFPYTDGAIEADMERRTEAIIRQCQNAGVTWGFVSMNLSKQLHKDSDGHVHPVTIPTRKMEGAGISIQYGRKFDLTQGNATYRHWEDLDFGAGNDYRRISLRFRNLGPGPVDFFWALPNGDQVTKTEACPPASFTTILLHTLDSTQWRPMWRLSRAQNTTVILNSVNEYPPIASEVKGENADWYDGAFLERPNLVQGSSMTVNAVNCRTSDFTNRPVMEAAYASIDRLEAKWGHLANRGPDFSMSDEYNWVGWPKVNQPIDSYVNAGHYVAEETIRAAMHCYHVTGFKPRGWIDLGLGVRSRGNSPLRGGFEDGVDLIPCGTPYVPAFWSDNPPAVNWQREFSTSGAREKAACVYLTLTDPRVLKEAIDGTTEKCRPTEIILQNTENVYPFELMQEAIEVLTHV